MLTVNNRSLCVCVQASALPNARTLLVATNAVLKNYIFCLFVCCCCQMSFDDTDNDCNDIMVLDILNHEA